MDGAILNLNLKRNQRIWIMRFNDMKYGAAIFQIRDKPCQYVFLGGCASEQT